MAIRRSGSQHVITTVDGLAVNVGSDGGRFNAGDNRSWRDSHERCKGDGDAGENDVV